MAFAPASPITPLVAGALRDSGDENNEEGRPVVPLLVAGYGDGTVRVFDVNAVEMELKLHPHSAAVTAIAFSADGTWNLSGSEL